MTPEKAIKVGVRAADVQVRAYANKYNGEWVAVVDDPERGERVLTQDASPYRMAHWLAELRRHDPA